MLPATHSLDSFALHAAVEIVLEMKTTIFVT